MNAESSAPKEANIPFTTESTLISNQNTIILDIPSSKNLPNKANSPLKAPHSVAIDNERQGQTDCPICLGDYLPEELKQPLGCRHVFCSACLIEYLSVKINNNEVLHIPCPQSGCMEIFTAEFVKEIVPSAEFNKYQELVTKKMALRGPKKNYCPQPGCLRPVKLVPGQKFTMCECGAKICNSCLNLSHEGKSCIETIDPDFEKYAIENGLRFCMMCKTIVFREAGCNHIKCAICDYEWCWICGREYNHSCPGRWDPIPPASVRNGGTLMQRFRKRWNESSLSKRVVICLIIFLLSPLLLLGFLIFFASLLDDSLNLAILEFEDGKKMESVCKILGMVFSGLLLIFHTIFGILVLAIGLIIYYLIIWPIRYLIKKYSAEEPQKPQLHTRWLSRNPENFTYRPTNPHS